MVGGSTEGTWQEGAVDEESVHSLMGSMGTKRCFVTTWVCGDTQIIAAYSALGRHI